MFLFELWVSQDICPIVELMGHMVVLFLVFFGNLHIVPHSGCINLHSHQKCKRAPFAPHLLQHLLFIDFFFIIAILTSMWWYFIAVLIDISLIMSSVEASYHVFMGHLYVFFAEVSVYVFCLFFWLGCLFFSYWADWAAYMFWRSILCQFFHLQLFSPILRVVFSFCL